MTREREATDYLHDILEAAESAELFTAGIEFDDFVSDRKTVFAVVHALEIIGEAAKNIPDAIRQRHPSVPWREMAGMRDNSSTSILESTCSGCLRLSELTCHGCVNQWRVSWLTKKKPASEQVCCPKSRVRNSGHRCLDPQSGDRERRPSRAVSTTAPRSVCRLRTPL